MLKTGPFRVNNASPELISENPFILNRDQTATQIAAQLLLLLESEWPFRKVESV